MKLFIPRIPADSTRTQLRHFIESSFNTKSWNPFIKEEKHKLVSYEIICIAEQNGIKETHGLIEIVPDKGAQEVIRRLHGKTFNGKRVIVRQYLERAANKDVDPQDNRRRPNLRVGKEEHPEIEGLEQFARSLSKN